MSSASFAALFESFYGAAVAPRSAKELPSNRSLCRLLRDEVTEQLA